MRLHALFVNEGGAGSSMMGHPRLEDAIRLGLAGRDDVDPVFRSLGDLGLVERLGLRRVPVLAEADLDAQQVRWYLVQSLRTSRLVRRELATRRTDVVHVHSQSIALKLRRVMRRVPTALSVDATVWDWRALAPWRPLRRHSHAMLRPALSLERRALSDASLVLAWTRWTRDAVLEVCPAARVVEHHPGLDISAFRPAQREPRQLPRVLFVGSRFPQKGGEDLLNALDPLLGTEVELDIVTPIELAQRRGVRTHSLDASDPRLIALYQQADIFCLPTHADTNPWAILEAMACGSSVVSTSVGAIPELLDHGRAGIIVEPRDPSELRRVLVELASDPGRRADLGAAARARVEERYNAIRQSRELLRLFREIA